MKDSSVCFLSGSDYSIFHLTTPDPVEVARFSTEGTIMNCLTGEYNIYNTKVKINHTIYMKERLISYQYQFHVLD